MPGVCLVYRITFNINVTWTYYKPLSILTGVLTFCAHSGRTIMRLKYYKRNDAEDNMFINSFLSTFWDNLSDPSSTAKFFWYFRQRRMAVSYRRFGTTSRIHPQGSSSFGILGSVEWQFLTDVLEQPLGSILKGQVLQDGTNSLPPNVSKKLPFYPA